MKVPVCLVDTRLRMALGLARLRVFGLLVPGEMFRSARVAESLAAEWMACSSLSKWAGRKRS